MPEDFAFKSRMVISAREEQETEAAYEETL
jgi:hypothetical protein